MQLALFIFFETESPYNAQAGLELLGSSHSPALASQVPKITDVHHYAQPMLLILTKILFNL